MNAQVPRRPTGRSGPSTVRQIAVAAAGAVAAVVVAGGAAEIAERPLWVLPVIVAGWVWFGGLLTVVAWRTRQAVGALSHPVVIGPLSYLAGTCLSAGAVLALGSAGAGRVAGVVLCLVAAAATTLAGVGRSARNRGDERSRRARTHSVAVDGVIVDDGLAAFPTTPHSKLATLTVEFIDPHGTPCTLRPRAV